MGACVCAASERLDKKFGAHYEFGDRREWVTSARTYFYEDEHVCDDNVTHIIDGINTVSGHSLTHSLQPPLPSSLTHTLPPSHRSTFI